MPMSVALLFKRILSPVGLIMLTCLLLAGFSGPALAKQAGMLQGSHGDRSQFPKSCRACHKGMTMALSGEETTCSACHADPVRRDEMLEAGYLKDVGGEPLADIEAELSKPYSHPTLKVRGVHRKLEALPEDLSNAARHAECVDCHNAHVLESENPFRGLKGRRVGNLIADVVNEFELCYRCHAESANLPGTSTNKHEEFKITNTSFHPVEGEGKSTYVVSLKEPYVGKKTRPGDVSIISCSDCHGNDNPDGPKGPHGSIYQGLLVENYLMEDGRSESASDYALCYKCHERSSILSNESFPLHSLHIQGRAGSDGTSCFTCHDAHGSAQYQHLIRFNEDVVAETADGRLTYDAEGYAARHGSCTLNCHGVEHKAWKY